jgi:2-polyprenyl-3-methyl-5-hydroxy-6-metoxy-1,4-benzoquinol methylase
MSSSHQYARESRGIGPDDSLRRLADWIPHGATVLELGPASGYFTRYLKEVLGCTVDAVERDPRMAEQARPFCRQLVVGDLATVDLSATLDHGSYQVIIAADIIEHLIDPQAVIDDLQRFLAPGGALLISVPNVAYAGLIAALLDGKFDYRDEGLLDRTHLRFFTRDSLAALLAACGLHVQSWAAVFRPLNESEFKIRLEALPTALRDVLLASPYALCYQWVVKAGLEPAQSMPAAPPRLQVDAFPVRAYCHVCADASEPDHEAVAWGEVGKDRQTLRIALPAKSRGPIRLNLSDRPGFLRIYGISLLAGEMAVWSWRVADGPAALAERSDGLSLALAADHVLASLHRAHAWVVLNTGRLALPVGGELVVELGWPMSADYLIAATGWQQAAGQQAVVIEALRQQLACAGFEPPPAGTTTTQRKRRSRHWLGRLLQGVLRR